jgi:hypothetical protein
MQLGQASAPEKLSRASPKQRPSVLPQRLSRGGTRAHKHLRSQLLDEVTGQPAELLEKLQAASPTRRSQRADGCFEPHVASRPSSSLWRRRDFC